jgi:hypothetical protein
MKAMPDNRKQLQAISPDGMAAYRPIIPVFHGCAGAIGKRTAPAVFILFSILS